MNAIEKFLKFLVVFLNFGCLLGTIVPPLPVPNYDDVVHLRPVFRSDPDQSPPNISENIESGGGGGKILSMHCLACCKLNHNIQACRNGKICITQTCIKYMNRLKSISPADEGRLNERRRGRQRHNFFPDSPVVDYDYETRCRALHPFNPEIRYLPAHALSDCVFHCYSPVLNQQFTHSSYNGDVCGDKKLCWNGECREQGDTLDYIRCRAKFPTRPVLALVQLECNIVCKTLDDNRIWIYKKEHSPSCDPPFWLPRKQDANSAFQ